MSDRYMVVSVGCLECSNGFCNPELIKTTNDLEEAKAVAKTIVYPGQEDRIVVDSVDNEIIVVNKIEA